MSRNNRGKSRSEKRREQRRKSVARSRNATRNANRRSSDAPALPLMTIAPSDLERVAVMSDLATRKIDSLVFGDPDHECGALLIGNLLTDDITGTVVALIDDVYTDGLYGGGADYSFSSRMQVDALNYIFREYGERKHMIGTVHSHARFDAFYSDVDYRMMNSRRSEEVHMVVSPSHRTYVLAYKDLDFEYRYDVVLRAGPLFRFRRNRL